MALDFTSIIIKGQYFENETILDIFNDKNIKGSIIYGRNGSGKSTISNAFLNYKIGENEFEKFIFLEDEMEVDYQKNIIFVFNEDFVDKNIKLATDKDGINAIVLFGEAANLDETIKNKLNLLEQEKQLIEKRNILQYTDLASSKCPEKIFDSIKTLLQSNWALRDQQIRKLKKKSSVKDDFVNKIINKVIPKESQVQLTKKYNEIFSKVVDIDENKKNLNTFSVTITNSSQVDIFDKLNRIYDRKLMTDFAKLVLRRIDEGDSNSKLTSSLILKRNSVCPICFQNISDDYLNKLDLTLKNIFDEEIVKFQNELESLLIPLLENIDFSEWNTINNVAKYINDIQQKINKYNELADYINSCIKEKINNMYTTKSFVPKEFDLIKSELETSIYNFNLIINEYNSAVTNYKKNISSLQMLNEDIAFCEIFTLKEDYKKLKEEKYNCEKLDEKSKIFITQTEEEIERLKYQKKDFGIALDELNSLLSLVFSSSERLYLKASSDSAKYNIYSKGKKIELNKLSVGERNIIALCYFFEKMKANSSKNNYYREELLVVIDDPISSFDYENKLGMYSLMKKMIGEIHKGNSNSKFIIFSHELEVCIFTFKIMNDLKIKINCKELSNRTLKNLSLEKISNYGCLLSNTYDIAIGQPSNENSFGNIIRKLLEAYANFNYIDSMDHLLTDSIYLNKIQNKELRDYFSNRMYRLVLHSASHTKDAVHQFPDSFTLQSFSSEEEVKTARDVLVFLYLLDNEHINRYFASNTHALRNIRSWLQDLQKLFIKTQNEEKKLITVF